MKVIVPLAGKGTRLLPLTRRVPKPLVRVAGRPVMDYVMDALAGLDVEELIVITGHLKDVVQRYVVEHYAVKARFVEQKTLDGTAGAINLARPYVDGPVLIVFVDTLFEADLSLVRTADADGILWAKEVEDYQRFGVIVTDGRGYMTKIVEKPATPISKLANIGLYYVADWRTLFDGIAHVLAQPPNRGEFYLTEAFQYMVEHGRRLRTARVAARRHRRTQRDDRGRQHDRGQHHREQHPGQERPCDAGGGARLSDRRRPGDREPRGGGERDGRRRNRGGEVGALPYAAPLRALPTAALSSGSSYGLGRNPSARAARPCTASASGL